MSGCVKVGEEWLGQGGSGMVGRLDYIMPVVTGETRWLELPFGPQPGETGKASMQIFQDV